MPVKVYGASPEGMKGRYSPAECIGAVKHRVEGNPDPKHVICRAAEPHHADADAALYPTHRCVLEEIREPYAHGGALYSLVQFREAAQDAERAVTGNGCRNQQHSLVNDRSGGNDRCKLAKTRAARPLQKSLPRLITCLVIILGCRNESLAQGFKEQSQALIPLLQCRCHRVCCANMRAVSKLSGRGIRPMCSSRRNTPSSHRKSDWRGCPDLGYRTRPNPLSVCPESC